MAVVAATIRTLRTEAGLSQAGLAARLGVSANTVARWERGEQQPPPDVLDQVRGACEPSLEEHEAWALVAALDWAQAAGRYLTQELAPVLGYEVEAAARVEPRHISTLPNGGWEMITRLQRYPLARRATVVNAALACVAAGPHDDPMAAIEACGILDA